MKQHRIWLAAVLTAGAHNMAIAKDKAQPSPTAEKRAAVLVELFTSEGCSSCPPADLLLEKLDQSQPIPGAAIIVLSEHVDYWNHIGWTDPYSSPIFSRRQEAYAHRFGLDGSYTPQMIVDGAAEFVGNDGRRAESAIAAASKIEKAAIRIARVAGGVRIEVDPLPASAGGGKAEVYLALVQVSATSDVLRGENQGRRLHHVAIVRSLELVGSVSGKEPFAKDILPGKSDDWKTMRIVAFVQEPGAGRVWGTAMAPAQ